ncbi:MAG: hypothetical protein AAFY21_04965, partial [Cyanobacteria bacterium J06641_2]
MSSYYVEIPKNNFPREPQGFSIRIKYQIQNFPKRNMLLLGNSSLKLIPMRDVFQKALRLSWKVVLGDF